MPKYNCTMSYTATLEVSCEVEASSEDEAEKKAWEYAVDNADRWEPIDWPMDMADAERDVMVDPIELVEEGA